MKELQKLGLTGNESKVYMTLLGLGSASVGVITEESGVHRRNVYDAIERLVKRGLVGHVIKGKIKYFQASNPANLLDMIGEEKRQLDKKLNILNSILPSLLAIHSSKKKESVIIYKGVKGIKTVLDDILDTGKPNLVLGAHKPSQKIKSHLRNFHLKRIKLKIRDRLIFDKNDNERADKLARMPYTEVRFLPKSNYSKTAVNIYGNKVAILMWSDPIAIVIENSEVAKSFRNYFEMIWNTLE
jgi:sugar-specific transcriptional regulator TrmB